MISSAMIFAAGLGKRMQPLTLHKPKPLIEINGRTMLDRALDHLVNSGVTRAVINTHYLATQIEKHLAKRKDIEIIISYEPELLETGGGLKNALLHLGAQPIYVINSDVVWIDGKAPALHNLAQNWRDDMEVLLLLIDREKAMGYEGAGDFSLSKCGKLERESPPRPYVFCGVQIIKPQLVSSIPDRIFSLSRFYFDNPKAYGMVHDGKWFHIGAPDSLKRFESEIT